MLPMQVTVAVIMAMAPVRSVIPVVATIHGSIMAISVVRRATVVIVVAMMARPKSRDRWGSEHKEWLTLFCK